MGGSSTATQIGDAGRVARDAEIVNLRLLAAQRKVTSESITKLLERILSCLERRESSWAE